MLVPKIPKLDRHRKKSGLQYLAVVQSDLQYGSNAFWTTLSNGRKNRLIRASKRHAGSSTHHHINLLHIITFKHCSP